MLDSSIARRRRPGATEVARTGGAPIVSSLLALAVALAGTWACRGSEPAAGRLPQPRLVLLYATCTLNKSFLSVYNPEIGFTPRLEKLASEGMVFDRHRTEVGMSGVAYASILAGSQAPHHGIFSHPKELFDSVELISEAFVEAGYEAFFWSHQGMASAELNYGQGIPAGNVISDTLRGDDERFQEILARLREVPEYKAFIFTNFTITHAPYSNRHLEAFCAANPLECELLESKPEDWVEERYELFQSDFRSFQFNFPETVESLGWTDEEVADFAELLSLLYRSNVYRLDRMFGRVMRFIDESGLSEQALIVFTADHGESLYDPADLFHWSHGASLETEVLDVPLIIRAPGLGVRTGHFDTVTRSIDLFPTLAGLAGVEAPRLPASPATTGIDLSGVVRGLEAPPVLAAYSHSGVFPTKSLRRHAPEMKLFFEYFAEADIGATWVAVREGETVLKYRRGVDGEWRFEAFDLVTDPGEEIDVYDPADPRFRSMVEGLRRYKVELMEAYAGWQEQRGTPDDGLSEEDLRRLRSLGYIQ